MKNIGLSNIALAVSVISLILIWIFDSSFGLILYLIGFALAIIDLTKAYTIEKLSPKDFFVVVCKEKFGSVITIFALIAALII